MYVSIFINGPPLIVYVFKKVTWDHLHLGAAISRLQTVTRGNFNSIICFCLHSYLLSVVSVRDNGSIVEKRMIEGVWKQPAELHSSTTVCRAPAMLQAEADEAKSTDSDTEDEQIVLLLGLIPASLCNKEEGQLFVITFPRNPYIIVTVWH